MKFTATSQKTHELGANVTGISTAKNWQFFFLNLEKQRGSQNTIKTLVVEDKEITDQTHFLEHIGEFYETLFKPREQKTAIEMKIFFSNVDIL